MTLCLNCANTHADKCTWFDPNNQILPEGAKLDKAEVPRGEYYKVTKCPNFTEDTGGSNVRADRCLPLIAALNRVNERDYISYFESVERELRKPKKITVTDDYGDFQIKRKCFYSDFLPKLIEIEQFYRSGFFGTLSDEDAELMIRKLRRKSKKKIKQRKMWVKK